MITPELKPKKAEILRACFDFIFGFENKKGDILDHWIAFADNLKFAPREFYEAIEKQLEARKVPGMHISREEFSEGGLISDKRIYLRLMRERLFIYACAAPFGTSFFLSCRIVHVRALVRLWHILAALLFCGIFGVLFLPLLGFTFTICALVTFLIALVAVMRNASTSPFPDLDTLLLRIPVISAIYDNWFREETYWRTDTRSIYLKYIPDMIRGVAEEITGTHGVKLMQQYRYAPVFGELYKPMPPTGQAPAAENEQPRI